MSRRAKKVIPVGLVRFPDRVDEYQRTARLIIAEVERSLNGPHRPCITGNLGMVAVAMGRTDLYRALLRAAYGKFGCSECGERDPQKMAPKYEMKCVRCVAP